MKTKEDLRRELERLCESWSWKDSTYLNAATAFMQFAAQLDGAELDALQRAMLDCIEEGRTTLCYLLLFVLQEYRQFDDIGADLERLYLAATRRLLPWRRMSLSWRMETLKALNRMRTPNAANWTDAFIQAHPNFRYNDVLVGLTAFSDPAVYARLLAKYWSRIHATGQLDDRSCYPSLWPAAAVGAEVLKGALDAFRSADPEAYSRFILQAQRFGDSGTSEAGMTLRHVLWSCSRADRVALSGE